jgi:hypothetical protein
VAKKNRRQIEDKIKKIALFHCERLRRTPGYAEDYKKFVYATDDEMWGECERLCEKYDLPFLPHPDQPDFFAYAVGAVVPKRKKNEVFFGKNHVSTTKPETFLVDVWRDIEIIKQELVDWVNAARKRFIERGYDKVPHADNFERYFKVYDLVHEKKKYGYELIAKELKRQGLYKGKSIKSAIYLAKQDYRTACKLIGIPSYKKPTTRTGPTCCIKNDDYSKWNTILKEKGLDNIEYVKGKSIKMKFSDGPCRKRLSSMVKSEEMVRKNMVAKRKRDLMNKMNKMKRA